MSKPQKKAATSKAAVALGFPYGDPVWPVIGPDEGKMILEMIFNLLSPIGEHRARVNRSKGKRSKKRKRAESSVSSEIALPPYPLVKDHITVGWRETLRALDFDGKGDHTIQNDTHRASRQLAAILVDKGTQPEVAWFQLPFLVCSSHIRDASRPKASLVSLPPGATARIGVAVGIPPVGVVGIFRDAPGAEALIDYLAEHVENVHIPWLEDPKQFRYHPVKIETTQVRRGPKGTNSA